MFFVCLNILKYYNLGTIKVFFFFHPVCAHLPNLHKNENVLKQSLDLKNVFSVPVPV